MISPLLVFVFSSFASRTHSFYIRNAALIEQCVNRTDIYLSKFETTKMRCFQETVRQVELGLEYTCSNSALTPTWSLHFTNEQSARWPSEVVFLTGTDRLARSANLAAGAKKLVITGVSFKVDSKSHQLTTYISTNQPNAPQCRLEFSVVAECSGATAKKNVAQLLNFVCYNGKVKYPMDNAAQRYAFNTFLNEHIKAGSSSVSLNPAGGGAKPPASNQTSTNTNSSGSNNKNPSASPQKNQNLPFFIGGGVLAGLVLLAIVGFVICRRKSPTDNVEPKLSVTSELD